MSQFWWGVAVGQGAAVPVEPLTREQALALVHGLGALAAWGLGAWLAYLAAHAVVGHLRRRRQARVRWAQWCWRVEAHRHRNPHLYDSHGAPFDAYERRAQGWR